MKKLINFLKDEEGATAVEYALLVALIGVALISAMTGLKGGISGAFQSATTQLGS
jgi:pilus assembly protein Flp/PilA